MREKPVRSATTSSKELSHHPAVDVSQPVVAAGVTVCQTLVVQAKEIEHRGVQIVEMDLPRDGSEAKLVGLAVGAPCLHTAAGQPHTIAFGLMFAAVCLNRRGPGEILTPRCAAELARPDDQGFLEQPS